MINHFNSTEENLVLDFYLENSICRTSSMKFVETCDIYIVENYVNMYKNVLSQFIVKI